MMVTEAATIEDLDEALAHLAAGLHAARCSGNECRIEVTWLYIDGLLDKRLAMVSDGQGEVPHA